LYFHTELVYFQCIFIETAAGCLYNLKNHRVSLCGGSSDDSGDPARKGWKGMLRYSIKRILLALLTVLIIAAITFLL